MKLCKLTNSLKNPYFLVCIYIYNNILWVVSFILSDWPQKLAWPENISPKGAEVHFVPLLTTLHQDNPIWMFPKIGKHPKMDGENHGTPPKKMDDLGGTIIFGNTHMSCD